VDSTQGSHALYARLAVGDWSNIIYNYRTSTGCQPFLIPRVVVGATGRKSEPDYNYTFVIKISLQIVRNAPLDVADRVRELIFSRALPVVFSQTRPASSRNPEGMGGAPGRDPSPLPLRRPRRCDEVDNLRRLA
jgi:hypothetical protein